MAKAKVESVRTTNEAAKITVKPSSDLVSPRQYVWVIEPNLFMDKGFSVSLYVLIEKKNAGARVMLRGYPKYIPPGKNRVFIFDKDEAEKVIKERLVDRVSHLLKQMNSIAKPLALTGKAFFNETCHLYDHKAFVLEGPLDL